MKETSNKYKIELSEDQWKEKLTAEEFRVLRKQGTETAFTGKYWDNKKKGVYQCAACNTPLYSSETKFKSGTGWPSFFASIGNNVETSTDYLLGYARTEIVCANCGGHLGHVFKDGPEPTGLRHCVNSVSLKFIVEE